jgi:hypothetical protein
VVSTPVWSYRWLTYKPELSLPPLVMLGFLPSHITTWR